eukprot:347384-Chlamydomonas_euryale.AAC.4
MLRGAVGDSVPGAGMAAWSSRTFSTRGTHGCHARAVEAQLRSHKADAHLMWSIIHVGLVSASRHIRAAAAHRRRPDGAPHKLTTQRHLEGATAQAQMQADGLLGLQGNSSAVQCVNACSEG